jgi:PRTRC genetic system ThiF family protein
MLTKPKTFDPHLNAQEIVLVGCGGTGGHLARAIARIIAHMKSLRMSVPHLRLIDPDIVEMKNVGRQLFSQAEIGMNKAEVTAKRLACAFGLEIEWTAEPFAAKRHVSRDSYGLILIDAVDNHLARQELAQVKRGLLIACGNSRSSGQVSIGNVSNMAEALHYLEDMDRESTYSRHKDTVGYLPNAYLLFPQLLEPEPTPIHVNPQPNASCAELVLQGEQEILINDVVATIAARYLQQLLFRQPIQSFLTYCNIEGMFSVKPVPICREELAPYLKPS